MAEQYVAGKSDIYKQVDRWIRQVTSMRIWHFADDIEDITSIAHLKLFSNLKMRRFRGESTFRTYVQRLARYTCIDQVRSQRVERGADPELYPVPATVDDPEQELQAKEEYQVFLKIFRSIGPECQKLWRMVFSESLNYKEIGAHLGIPEGTVKRKVHECKRMAMELKERLI